MMKGRDTVMTIDWDISSNAERIVAILLAAIIVAALV
jgi:hypothetical protein